MNIFSTSETLIEALKKSEKNEIIDNYRKLLKENNEIPKFFISHSNSEKEYKNSFFANMMINLANQQSFHAILENYPSKDDVQFLRNAYEEMAKNSHVRVMRYTTYKQLRQKWPEKFQPILSSKLFVEIGGHSMHTINVDELFKHLDMIPRCVAHYLRLNQYDYLKTGSIDEESFKKYIYDMAKELKFVEQNSHSQPNFLNRFSSFVLNRILVVLDPIRVGKVIIENLIQSPLYLSFVMLESSADDKLRNPFSPNVIANYINEFEAIDEDGDGYIIPSDLFKIQDAKFTNAFVNRVFDASNSLCANGRGNFSWYLRFRFVWDNLGSKWANQIMFDILDVDGNGKITLFEMNYFFREISQIFHETHPEQQLPSLDSWVNEQFDHLSVKNGYITKEIFILSKDSDQLVRQLVDLRAFCKLELSEDIYNLE